MEYENSVSLEAAGHLFKKIGDHDPKTIAKVLMNGKSHPLIKLENINLGDEGVKTISKALGQQSIVSSLDLSCNSITDIGIKHLCEGIENNRYLLFLKLDNNPIGDQGFKYLCSLLKSKQCILKSLYISDCSITNKSMEHLVDALSVNQSLETIHLNSNKISNEGAIVLSKLINSQSHLKNLSLFFCGIGDNGANAFLHQLEKPEFIKYRLLALTIKGNKINTGIIESINKCLIAKKNHIKAERMKAEHQKMIDEQVKLKMKSVNMEMEKKMNSLELESKRKLEEEINNINEESKKKLDQRINNINEESKKKLNEKLKNIEKKEETLNARDSDFSNRLKQFEKEKKKKENQHSIETPVQKSLESSSSNIKKQIKKKYSDSVIIVIAGDKSKDKELLIEYCMSALEDCRIEAENDFEKIFTGIIQIDNKPIHFTFVNTSSDDRYSRLRALQYEQADAAVIAFTTNDRVSFEDIPFQWIPEIEFMGKIPIFITGMYPEKRSNPLKPTDISVDEGRNTSLKFGASNYFEPTNSLDIKNISQIVYKDVKKKKK
ncbi:hypothetical protein RB653_006458 [Dictyostelium firmibasis]|uniref:Leucine-rich repeat-containing protein n=1 Tax=Dictyostelium firmibasis TaxID=79012 RepID=A0AAN7Z075_9MYCE